ncbi:PREDICTED: ankyrin repeat-containing protein ITN1-like [Camelina sativa]|uniref:Ankyrin repeat-containing protein ITN1-like n=1 Tax=Camelina sativa TaxID=90675 RepID=A0ABM1RPR8_CAMSA|nr:PREDICTED: ankyrin repeat-containing protein ITN1-like [Camelina sativa]
MDHRLFDAARTGDITTLKLLLQEDPLLLERLSLSSPENPLHVSAFTGQATFTAEVLRHNQGLALEPNLQGFSPLHIASASGKIEVVRVLLSVGQKRDLCFLKDKDGLIPLHSAAQRGRIEVIKELISSFPESLDEQTAFLETPLHVAVKNNQVEATKLLLQEIKNRNTSWGIVNQENREGNTILHLATLGKQLQIVEMLIGEEAILHGSVDVNKQNRSWLTPKDVLDVVIETEGGSVSEMHRIVQIFQTAEARNAIEKRKNLKPIDRSRNPLRMIKRYLDYEITNSTLEKRETLLVVATLIATLTFTGVLQPPGAFRGEDSNGGSGSQNNNNIIPIINTNFGSRNSTEGQAIMAASTVDFTLYATFNAIGFFASVTMISLLTKGFPLRNWIRLCVISIVAIYLVAVVYIAPNEKTFWLVVLSVSSLLVLRESYLFFKSLLKAFQVARRL